jgi:mono/diheme cytochrome c family protein
MRTAIILILAAFACACTRAESGTSPANEGKVLGNPVKATPESIAAGKRHFDKLCADCHGEKGDGVSPIAATMAADEVRPPDLTDDKWDHGATDGELFVTIRDGVGGPGAMKGLNGRPGIGPTEIWQMVNYIRSLRK